MGVKRGILARFFINYRDSLITAISPGPDFIFVSQQTLSRGRKAGMICALGVALGLRHTYHLFRFGLSSGDCTGFMVTHRN